MCVPENAFRHATDRMSDKPKKFGPLNATTSQSLGALLKSARDIKEKAKG